MNGGDTPISRFVGELDFTQSTVYINGLLIIENPSGDFNLRSTGLNPIPGSFVAVQIPYQSSLGMNQNVINAQSPSLSTNQSKVFKFQFRISTPGVYEFSGIITSENRIQPPYPRVFDSINVTNI